MEAITHDLAVSAEARSSYDALATPAGIRGWWAKNSDVGEAIGSPIELRFTRADMSAVMNFDLTGLEPGHSVEWTCTANSNPIWVGSKLIWLIETAVRGSVVHFRHEGLSEGGPMYEATVQGWQLFMASLQAYLDGGVAHPSD